MANELRTKPITKDTFTLTLAGLADGSGRQSTLEGNSSNYPAALIYLQISSGAAAPTAGTFYEVYLLRGDDTASSTHRSDNAGASDAAITIENAPLLGVIGLTATTDKKFYAEFDTSSLGPLGPEWGIAVVNQSGNSLDATEGDHFKGFIYYVPEVQ